MKNEIVTRKGFDDVKSFIDNFKQVATQFNEGQQGIGQKLDTTLNIVDKFGEIKIESKRIDLENSKVKVELAKVVADFKLKQGFLQAVFSERSRTIDKHFQVIDQGLRDGNDELVLKGLRSASNFVSTNPLDNFDTFRSVLLDKNAPLDLDF